ISHELCHETIYQYVYGVIGRTDQLYRLLPRGRRRRRVRYARRPRGLNIPEENTIVRRPSDVGDRITFGHWECNLMAFEQKFGRHNLTSLVERKSRYTFVSRNPSRHSTGVMSGIVANLCALPPQARRTITFDRGTEFAAYMTLKHKLDVTSYFCAPKAP
ncbi:MAG: IS30 family transposase, partial [Janthinobacterium lividum]